MADGEVTTPVFVEGVLKSLPLYTRLRLNEVGTQGDGPQKIEHGEIRSFTYAGCRDTFILPIRPETCAESPTDPLGEISLVARNVAVRPAEFSVPSAATPQYALVTAHPGPDGATQFEVATRLLQLTNLTYTRGRRHRAPHRGR